MLPGSGIPLPPTARLKLKKNDWYEVQPADHVPVVDEVRIVPDVFILFLYFGFKCVPAPRGCVRGSRGFREDRMMDMITGRAPPWHEAEV